MKYLFAFLSLFTVLAINQARPLVDRKISFEKEVEPIFEKHCYFCHGPDRQRGGLRLDDPEDALRGSENGKVIVPGKSARSRLLQLISGQDEELIMPPKGKRLSKNQIQIIRAWIDQGAKFEP